jgi:hypothetical protein
VSDQGSAAYEVLRHVRPSWTMRAGKIAADIDRADLVTCAAVLERFTSALAGRNPRTG